MSRGRRGAVYSVEFSRLFQNPAEHLNSSFLRKKELKQDFHRQNCNFVTKRKRILIASRMLDSVVYHHQNHT